jgi:outer membrane protein
MMANSKKMQKLFPLILVILTSLPLIGKTRTATLDECVKIALQNHPDLFAAEEDFKNSIFQYKIAKAGSGIQISSAFKTVETEKEDYSGDYRIPGRDTNIGLFAGLTASYVLFDPQKFFREEKAKLNINLQKLREQMTKNRITSNVNNAYFDYLIAKKNVLLYQKLYEQDTLSLKQAEIQYKSGTISIIDYNRSTIKAEESKLNVEKAKNKENSARINLFSSMGIKGSEELKVIYIEPEKLPAIRYKLKELYGLALIFNLNIREARVGKELARLNIISKKGLRKPKVDFSFQLGYLNQYLKGVDKMSENYDSGNWTPTVAGAIIASLPIYTSGGISAQVDSAYSGYNKAQYNERNVIRQVNNKILESFGNIRDLDKQIEMSRQLIDLSHKQYRMIKTNYESGLASQAELFRQEVEVLDSETKYMRNIYNYIKEIRNLSEIVGISGDHLWHK